MCMYRIIVCIFGMCIGGALHAMALEFEQTTLENGMKIIVVPDHRSPVVINSVWYRAGSIDEQPGKRGIAHMLEHMMFKGTPKYPAGQLDKLVSRNGGQLNAFTSRDYTAYYEKVSKDKLPLMMELEADRMVNLNITDEDFQPERNVVLEERRWRSDSKPTDRFFEKYIKKHYAVHPYGNPIIGWREDIEGYTLQDNLNWYNTHYAPNNATLLLVGDVTLAEVMPLVEKYFAPLKVKNTPPRANYVEPLRDAEVRFTEVDSELKVPVFYKSYRAPSAFQGIAGENDMVKDALEIYLMTQILGDSTTGRLYEDLVKKQQLADEASASYSAYGAGESTIDIYVQPKPGVTLAQVEEAVEDVIASFVASRITEDELARAKTGMLAHSVYGRDDLFFTMYQLGLWLMAGGEADTFDDWQEELPQINTADIQRVAQTYLQPNLATTGLLVGSEEQLGHMSAQ